VDGVLLVGADELDVVAEIARTNAAVALTTLNLSQSVIAQQQQTASSLARCSSLSGSQHPLATNMLSQLTSHLHGARF
jgi:hypothetical protein